MDLSDSFVVDELGILTETQSARIEAYHRRLLEDLDIFFSVAILKDAPASIEEKTLDLFEQHTLGRATRGAKGLLLVIDPVGMRTRIETGYDLEPLFTDGFVSYIQHRQMAPFYASGRLAEGIEATVELLVTEAMRGVDRKDYQPNVKQSPLTGLSGGGGANAVLAGSAGTQVHGDVSSYRAQTTVDGAFSEYLRVLEHEMTGTSLDIYSDETRSFFFGRRITAAQQRTELLEIRAVYASRRAVEQGNLAVIGFPASKRVPPYFFRRQQGLWRIDLAATSRLIGFDHLNQWYMREKNSEFSFAFN